MKYTAKEIEGLENLCFFLCEHQETLHNKIMEAARLIRQGYEDKAGDLLTMEVPIIQGTRNQFDLSYIGENKVDTDKIRVGVDALLKAYPRV